MGCISTQCEKFWNCRKTLDGGCAIGWATCGSVVTSSGNIEENWYCGKLGNYKFYEPIKPIKVEVIKKAVRDA